MLENGAYPVPHGKMAVIVTHLEMLERPQVREVALPSGVSFRRVQPTQDWYRDIFHRVGTQDWMWYGRLKLSDAALEETLADPQVEFYTLSKDGKDEALLELDFRVSDACELAYFGLTSKLIGSGSGRFLMNQAITRAWDAKISRFHVHTCTTDSPQALTFYQRSGFVPYKREVDIDDDPRVTGVIPKSSAAGIPII